MDLSRRLGSLVARSVAVKPARLHGTQAVASITFDDFPRSAWLEGGPVLARHGARATYYAAGGYCGRTVDGVRYFDESDLKAVAAAGHEIGAHGFAHRPASELSHAALADDAARNEEFLKACLGGAAPVSYAFPYGAATLAAKRFCAARFATARGVRAGVNDGKVDLAQLRTISLECRCWDEEAILAAIHRARARQGWIVFYTHDVSERPTRFGSMPGMLDWVLKKLAAAEIAVLPVREALPVALGTP